MTESAAFLELVDRWRAAPPRSAADLSATIGVTLLAVPRNSGIAEARDASTAHGVHYSRVEWRRRPASGALIVLELNKSDIARRVVLDRYSPLDVTNVPRGDSLDEETYYSRREPWGTISFGFAEYQRDRLSTVVLNLDAPAQ